jgi:hypothetical protein
MQPSTTYVCLSSQKVGIRLPNRIPEGGSLEFEHFAPTRELLSRCNYPRSEHLADPFVLEGAWSVRHIGIRQGPWIVDLRTPPGPEGSNGSLLCFCRGYPGINFLAEHCAHYLNVPGHSPKISSAKVQRCCRTGTRY